MAGFREAKMRGQIGDCVKRKWRGLIGLLRSGNCEDERRFREAKRRDGFVIGLGILAEPPGNSPEDLPRDWIASLSRLDP